MAFNPGRLSDKRLPGVRLGGFEFHAEFETECAHCHAAPNIPQFELCEKCHTQVKEQIATQSGIHGKITPVEHCADCHPEHRGVGFDPGTGDLRKFNHNLTAFSLIRHQVNYDAAPMDCMACHSTENGFTTPQENCSICHGIHDQGFLLQHIQDFGPNCLGCHDGKDRMAEFDHAQTAFPLEGQHAGLKCLQCHSKPDQSSVEFNAPTFSKPSVECASCHAEPAFHRGVFSSDCGTCHNVEAWAPATLDGKPFDHEIDTGFSLAHHAQDYNREQLTCAGCHTETVQEFNVQTCSACHAGEMDQQEDGGRAEFMQKHVAQFGPACLDCHDGVDRMSNFDHEKVFALLGVHETLACDRCHANQTFSGTPRECSQCHAEPEIHAGFFGLQCQDCHTEQAWSPARLIKHGFPLDHGGEGDVACTTCHTRTYTEYTCYGCHEHEPQETQEKHLEEGVSMAELPDCARCHPNGLKEESDD